MLEHATAPFNETCTRPASGSALLAGHVVTLTVPPLTMSSRLLAIGDDWTELRCASQDDQALQEGELLSVGVHCTEPIGGYRPESTPPSRW